MFHWICPECGREIPPSIRECQACDPSAAVSNIQPPVVEPIESIPAAASVAHAEATPVEARPHPLAAQILLAPPVALTEPAAPVEQQQVAEAPPLPAAAVTEPAVEPAIQTAPVAEQPLVEHPKETIETAPVAHVVPEPVIEPTPVAAEVAAVTEPTVEVAPEPEPVIAAPPVAEVPEPLDPFLALAEEIRAVQTARAAALAAPPESAGILELAEAVGVQQQSPITSPVTPPINPAPVLQSVERPAPQPSRELEVAAPQQTAVALLAPPAPEPVDLVAPEPEIISPMLPFAPMQPYTAATSRSIMPVPPRPHILAADSGPRITLPGPTLPPELTRLQDANVVTVIGEQTAQRTKVAIKPAKSGGGAPGWLVSGGVMLLLLAAALAVVFYLYPRTVADAKPTPTPAEAATAPAPSASSSPLSKFIEVTGFRIVVDSNKKSEVQYLVVNHSAADISNANVFITLHGVKPGQAPVCRFSFKVPSLGPFESKEMSSPIEKAPPTLSLPTWQDLRADVQISQ